MNVTGRQATLLVAHALQLSIWATSEPHGSVPRRRLGRTYRLYGRWNLSACVANDVAAEDHEPGHVPP